MTLRDISHGPDWVLWVVVVVLAMMSGVLLSGHGANLIAGYNTASKAEKAKYDEKKLCRVYGMGLSVITVLMAVVALLQNTLPAAFAYVLLGVILLDVAVMLVLKHTVCKR